MRAPIRRVTTAALIERIWFRRARITSYDAAYVVLAERLSCPLVTRDRALSRAPGLRIEVLAV